MSCGVAAVAGTPCFAGAVEATSLTIKSETVRMEASSLTITNGILALSAEAANDSCHSVRNEDQSLLA